MECYAKTIDVGIDEISMCQQKGMHRVERLIASDSIFNQFRLEVPRQSILVLDDF